MKKFSFSLERVLSYKEQTEQNLRNEHGQAVRKVQEKEGEIDALEKTFAEYKNGRESWIKTNISISRMKNYEAYLSFLIERIASEKQKLKQLKKEEEKKREDVIEAKKETSSIQMLKDKKRQEYTGLMRKQEEREVEEFVSNRSFAEQRNG